LWWSERQSARKRFLVKVVHKKRKEKKKAVAIPYALRSRTTYC